MSEEGGRIIEKFESKSRNIGTIRSYKTEEIKTNTKSDFKYTILNNAETINKSLNKSLYRPTGSSIKFKLSSDRFVDDDGRTNSPDDRLD
jgi:hypothetical protein